MISSLAAVSGTLAAASRNNWYSITLATAQSLNLDLQLSFGSSTVYLDSANGTTIAYSSGYTYSDGWLNRVVAAGTYYIDVQNNFDAAYTLTASLGSPAVGSVGVDTAGNSLVTARLLGTLTTTPLTIAESIGGSDPYDYYAFNVSTISKISATLSGLTDNAYFYILNASGQQIDSGFASPTSNGSMIQTLSPLTPGNYYLEVADTSSTPTGYSLSLSATPAAPAAGVTSATARPMGALSAMVQQYSDILNPVSETGYYSFSLAGPSRVNLSLTGLQAGTTLRIRNALGTSIISASGDYSNGAINLYDDLPALPSGTYFVSVESNSNLTSTPYTLRASATAIPDAAGNSFAAATSLGTITTGKTTVSDYIGSVDSADYYSFTLATASSLSTVLTDITRNVPLRANVTLYSSTQAQIGYTGLANGNGDDQQFYNLAAGTYTIAVTPTYSGDDSYYTLGLTTAITPVGTPATENAGATLATAHALGTLSSSGTNIADWVGTGDTQDWYQVTVATTTILKLDVTGLVASANLYLTNVTGAAIASSGGNASVGASVWQTVAPGTYYIEVTNGGGGNTGYNLTTSAQVIVDGAGNSTASGRIIGALGPSPQIFADYVGPLDTDDYYQFTLASTSTVNAHLSGLSNGADIYLRDISGNPINSTSGKYDVDGSLQSVLAAGTYFASVFSNSPTDYALALSATPLASTAGTLLTTAAPLTPTAASIVAQLDALEAQAKAGMLSAVSLSDPGTPVLAIPYAQAIADADVLKAIVTPYNLNLGPTDEKWAGPTLQSLGFGATALKAVQFADGRLVFDTSDPAAQVYRIYLSAFGRVPDEAGQHTWTSALEAGQPLLDVAQAFIGSTEFTGRYGGNLTDTQYVTLLYQNVLGRSPDPAGLAGWQNALNSGQTRAQLLVAFSEVAEHVNATAPAVRAGLWDLDESAAQVARLYDTVFQRIPDSAGLAFWSGQLKTGASSLLTIAAAFIASAEFQAVYGALDNSGFVNTLYVHALHRGADMAGLNGWLAQLNAGASRASVVLAFSESAEHQSNTAAVVNNPDPAQQGILAGGPIIASASVIGGGIDHLEAEVKTGATSSITVAGSTLGMVPVTAGQILADKDALGFMGGNYALTVGAATVASAGGSVSAANLGTTTQAKYVQFADGRLVFDTSDRAAEVYRLYDSAFGRVPDAAGEHGWSQALAATTPLSDIAQAFLGSAEFISRYGANQSDSSLVTLLYQNVLHRAPDAAGLNGWLATLGNGTPRAQVLTSFSESLEHIANTSAAIHSGIYDLG